MNISNNYNNSGNIGSTSNTNLFAKIVGLKRYKTGETTPVTIRITNHGSSNAFFFAQSQPSGHPKLSTLTFSYSTGPQTWNLCNRATNTCRVNISASNNHWKEIDHLSDPLGRYPYFCFQLPEQSCSSHNQVLLKKNDYWEFTLENLPINNEVGTANMFVTLSNIFISNTPWIAHVHSNTTKTVVKPEICFTIPLLKSQGYNTHVAASIATDTASEVTSPAVQATADEYIDSNNNKFQSAVNKIVQKYFQ